MAKNKKVFGVSKEDAPYITKMKSNNKKLKDDAFVVLYNRYALRLRAYLYIRDAQLLNFN
jgi:hypothetical protein